MDPQDRSPRKRTGRRVRCTLVPDRRGRPAFARPPAGYPTSARAPPPPPPLGPLGPPRARGGGSGVSRRHCSASSALHHVSGKQRFFTPRGRSRGLQREARGYPRRRRGRRGRRGGGRWPGQCVGGEGSRTAAAAASSLRPPQLFPQPGEVPAPGPSGPAADSPGKGRAAELGAGFRKQPALHGAEANLAARPAPQPFSRGSGRGGGCGGGSRTCCRHSATCPLPGAGRTACLATRPPPPKLLTAPGPRAAAAAAMLPASPHFPPPHLPTAGEVRAVSARVLRPTGRRGPPAGQHHSRPRRQFLRPVPHSPDLLPQSTK